MRPPFNCRWCQPCKVLLPKLKAVAEKHDLKILKIDIEQFEDIAEAIGVSSLPTVHIVRKEESLGSKLAGDLLSQISKALRMRSSSPPGSKRRLKLDLLIKFLYHEASCARCPALSRNLDSRRPAAAPSPLLSYPKSFQTSQLDRPAIAEEDSHLAAHAAAT